MVKDGPAAHDTGRQPMKENAWRLRPNHAWLADRRRGGTNLNQWCRLVDAAPLRRASDRTAILVEIAAVVAGKAA